MTPSRPNILLVMFDQLAPQSLAMHGHPLVKTPHLDALAADGVVFDNAYCASPLCAPARFAMMTGRLCSSIDAWDNAAELRSEFPTFCHHLRRLGYFTALAGKMHFVGADQLHGYEQRLTTDMYPADFGWTPDWRHPEKRWFWYHNMQSVVEAGVYERTLEIDFDEEVAHQSERKLYDLGRHGDGRPWFLTASFMHPHDPFMTPRAYWDRYEHDAIDMPRVQPPLPGEADPHTRRMHHLYATGDYRVTDEHVRNARHAYYGMISWADEQLGRLLHVLGVTGQRDDTIVIVTSDHGEMLGERGLWYKMTFFERSARVPLVVTAPERFTRRRVAANVSHLDLLPTLVELAGGDLAETAEAAPCDGRSLLPELRGGSAGLDDCVLGEYFAEGVDQPMFMIKRGGLKYIACQGDPPQLYDLATDPDERVNLAESQAHAPLLQRFASQAAGRWDGAALRERVLASQGARLYVHQAGLAGAPPRWDFQPQQDASALYNRNYGGEMYDSDRNARIPRRDPPPPDGPGME